METRKCVLCNQVKDLTGDNYPSSFKKGVAYFWSRCRSCVATRRKRNEASAKDGYKTCNLCLESKPVSEYHFLARSADKLAYKCKSCVRCLVVNRYHKRDKQEVKARNEVIKLKRYGLDLESFSAMLESQNNACAICKNTSSKNWTETFCVDHDHKTGKVRGLLCFPCNAALGQFQDSETVLLSAIDYLKKSTLL